jgi:hypothetical protein
VHAGDENERERGHGGGELKHSRVGREGGRQERGVPLDRKRLVRRGHGLKRTRVDNGAITRRVAFGGAPHDLSALRRRLPRPFRRRNARRADS